MPIPGILRTETFVNLDMIKGGWHGIDTTQIVNALKILPKPNSKSIVSRRENIPKNKPKPKK
jgi:hypothetical protein